MVNKTTEIRIKDHLEQFLNNKIYTLSEMNLEDMDINPFLIAIIQKQFIMKTPRDLAEWLVRQRLERGTVTTFGTTLQNIVKEFCNDRPRPTLTARMIKNKKTYNMIVKSGPKHNSYVVSGIKRSLLRSKKEEPDSIPLFGMCYGNENSVGNIVKKYSKEIQHLVGRDLWEFISGEEDTYNEILLFMKDVGENYRDEYGNTLGSMLEKKIKQIENELKKSYGTQSDIFWKNVVEDVY